jgi:hypothetical protein
MFEAIDIYCERTSPDFWAEPVNALTNVAFFVAAFFAWKLARERGALNTQSGILIALLVAIGIGSTLFHTLAVGWASLADVIPIVMFQAVFLLVYSRSVIRLDWTRTIVLLVAFVMTARYFNGFGYQVLNGSLQYGAAIVFLGGLGVYHWFAHRAQRYALLAATGLFTVSLTLRSLDMDVCEAFPLGVHFLWHVFNAGVLYLALRGLLCNMGIGRPR